MDLCCMVVKLSDGQFSNFIPNRHLNMSAAMQKKLRVGYKMGGPMKAQKNFIYVLIYFFSHNSSKSFPPWIQVALLFPIHLLAYKAHNFNRGKTPLWRRWKKMWNNCIDNLRYHLRLFKKIFIKAFGCLWFKFFQRKEKGKKKNSTIVALPVFLVAYLFIFFQKPFLGCWYYYIQWVNSKLSS